MLDSGERIITPVCGVALDVSYCVVTQVQSCWCFAGMDWHLRIDDDATCEACDSCGDWNDVAAVTSTDHNNNSGDHDDSTWGLLFGK